MKMVEEFWAKRPRKREENCVFYDSPCGQRPKS
jgi:hypothetical protein